MLADAASIRGVTLIAGAEIARGVKVNRPACRKATTLIAVNSSRISSAVEQRFCKPLVGSSILSSGTIYTGKSAFFARA
jgi:hypothetical protein